MHLIVPSEFPVVNLFRFLPVQFLAPNLMQLLLQLVSGFHHLGGLAKIESCRKKKKQRPNKKITSPFLQKSSSYFYWQCQLLEKFLKSKLIFQLNMALFQKNHFLSELGWHKLCIASCALNTMYQKNVFRPFPLVK